MKTRRDDQKEDRKIKQTKMKQLKNYRKAHGHDAKIEQIGEREKKKE